jgi:hypothetical protein
MALRHRPGVEVVDSLVGGKLALPVVELVDFGLQVVGVVRQDRSPGKASAGPDQGPIPHQDDPRVRRPGPNPAISVLHTGTCAVIAAEIRSTSSTMKSLVHGGGLGDLTSHPSASVARPTSLAPMVRGLAVGGPAHAAATPPTSDAIQRRVEPIHPSVSLRMPSRDCRSAAVGLAQHGEPWLNYAARGRSFVDLAASDDGGLGAGAQPT